MTNDQPPWNPETQRPDVAVVVALKEELRELLVVTGGPHAWPNPTYGAEDYLLLAPSDEGRAYRVVVFLMGEMTPPAATQAANRLLALQPALTVSLGIACSLADDDVRLCDVLVADQVNGYDAKSKAVDDGKGGWTFVRGSDVFRATDEVSRMADGFEISKPLVFEAWGKACAEDLRALVAGDEADAERIKELVRGRKLRKTPSVVKGHLASGMTVAAGEAFREWVRGGDRNLKALEMEAVGVLRAAHERKVPASTLVLRGISDLGDGNKKKLDAIGDGALRKAAMRSATRLLWALMRTGRLPRVEGEEAVSGSVGASAVSATPALSGKASVPSVKDDGPLDVERVVDLLANVLSDGQQATLVAERAGFPRGQLPAFTSSLVFWHKVVNQANDGMLPGGARPLLQQAAKLFPNHPELARWRS